MDMASFVKKPLAALAAGMLVLTAGAAMAQSGDWKAARDAGLIGEQADGYLGVVGAGNADLRAMVQDINIRRKQSYTEKAQQTGSTVEQFALTSGCNLVKLTPRGTKYRDPSGTWRTQTGEPPVRHPSCI